jgi:predicted adenine nucleotide alpha hydrolase (AANH) superfamily ATPase
MKILLHICCAPCLIYPLERFKKQGFSVEGLFYNPNIHPFAEYANRRAAVESLSSREGLSVGLPEYKPAEFFQAINLKELPPQRCLICWSLRLGRAAQAAKEKDCDYFSTTLLVSPYQDQEALKRIGRQIAQQRHIDFFYEDFRPGFRQAHQNAKSQGIYCQKYCGCLYSEIERCRKPPRP